MSKCRYKGSCGNRLSKTSEKSSWLSALIIILLPKCPFCVMAYSGAVTLCSGKMYPNSQSESVYFILGLSLIILLGIALNYKGTRTIFSLLLATTGIALMTMSQVYWFSSFGYYSSVFIILIAIWNNGSLHYLLNKLSNSYSLKYIKK